MVPEHILAAMHPPNHKTIFLLDHTPYFGGNCESLIEFDFTKYKGPGLIPLAPIAKSLWTCSVEAAIEYCRITWDLFASGKLIRFIVSDNKAHCLNSWSPSQQNLSHILNGLAAVGVPPAESESKEYSIFHGVQAAVQAMCECTEQQHEKRTSLDENTVPVVNRCRLICITSVVDNDSVSIIEERLNQEVEEGNKVAASSDLLIPIDHCEFVILNVQPVLQDTNIAKHSVSPIISSETHHVKASTGIANKLSSLILEHYDLASTTVTGIPMKEEQNASSSANYDVEILHPAKAHETLFQASGIDLNLILSSKEGLGYSSVTLRWSTPRGCTTSEMHNCTTMHRITPVDVNSRPSSCLINFLLGGRSVMLEVIRQGGQKTLSHMLAAHAGQIYMHSLAIGRTPLDDPPSISEGIGGKVTDYRITDFGQFMQQNKLVPMKPGKSVGNTLKRVRPRLERYSKYWPLTISSTIIFNCKAQLEPILNLMVQPELRESDVNQCKQCIYTLIGNEAKNEPLHLPPAGQKNKGMKREEQYKQLWAELETFLRAHCITDKHINILNCLLEVRNKDKTQDGSEKVELDQALKELEQMKSSERASVIRATTDSPLSPDASLQPSLHHKTLLELWVSKFCRQKPRPEFAGLATAQPLPNGRLKAKLYAHMKDRSKTLGKSPRPILE